MKKRLAASQPREHIRHLPRIFWIDQQIRSGHYPNNSQIAAHFEISSRTAQRTIEYMRDQLRLPIEYVAAERGWHYSEPHVGLTAVELTEADLVTLLLAEKLARQYRGTAIGERVSIAFAKILNAATSLITVDLKTLSEAHTFEAAVTTEIDPSVFGLLGSATINRRTIDMSYYTASRGELTERRVDPLHLRNANGDWYLIAWDHSRREPRDFLVSRIRRLAITADQFQWPDGFDLKKYLTDGFGMIRGGSSFRIELEFDAYQSRWIRERSEFHPTEEREELPDGRLRLRMTATALDGVKRFVLQYGGHIRVLHPPELRDLVRAEIDAMGKIYDDSGHGDN
ncbi:MAG: WYL domain-containing protein [Acidobacteria bacterium]|nr:WYL domain-containing protein [Acidobacteriota bacterium]